MVVDVEVVVVNGGVVALKVKTVGIVKCCGITTLRPLTTTLTLLGAATEIDKLPVAFNEMGWFGMITAA